MGQGISSGELKEEFNRFEEKINESSSLPIYLCFTLQIIDPTGSVKTNISKKLQAVVNLLEEKHISKTNRNHYALVLNDSNQFYSVNFCNSDEFINQIYNLFSKIAYRNNDNRTKEDLYEICSNRLNWKKSIKVLANLNLSNAEENTDSKDRLNDNFLVEIFDLKSLQDFDLFLSLFGNVAAKRVEVEKLTPQYKPTKDYKYRQLVTYTGYEEIFDKDKIPLTKEMLSKLDKKTMSELKKATIMKKRHFYIDDVPFTNGVEVYCFFGYYINSNKQKVTKVFKLAKYKENDLRENYLAQVISRQLANEFSRSVKNEIKVEYLLPSLAFINNQDKIYLMEDYNEGFFHKFTNNSYVWPNSKWTEEEKLLVDFSHWTNEWTDGNLMVTDLQGWKIAENRFVLTDPAIHSKESIFGKTDLGSTGFGRYFMFHKDICQEEIWKREENVENIPDKSDETLDDKKEENGVRNSQNKDADSDVIKKEDERIKGESARKSNEKKAKEVEDRGEKNLKPENKDLAEKSLKRVERKEEPKKANENIIDEEDEDVVTPKTSEKTQECKVSKEKETNEEMSTKLEKREKSNEDNRADKKITKIEESNTILLYEVVKILKNDIALIKQNQSYSIDIEKIQNRHNNLKKIETSLNHKSNSIKNNASLLLGDLNLIYYELYDHYRNVTITVYKKDSPEKMPISFNSKLDELCRFGVRLVSTYLSDEPRTLNFIINFIISLHLTLNLDEIEDFSQNSLPEYEQFIGKFGNPEQNENFAKLKKKFLLKSPRNHHGFQNDRNIKSNNKDYTEKDSNQKVQSSSDNGQSSNRATNKDMSPGNNVANNADNIYHKKKTSAKTDSLSPGCKETSSKPQSTNQSSNQNHLSEVNVDYKNDGTPYVDHTTRAPFKNKGNDFKTLKTKAMSSVLDNNYETFEDISSISYFDFILAAIIDEFMFIDKHFIKISIIYYSRKDIEEIQNKLFDYGKFKIKTIKKILSCLIKSYEKIYRTYTILLNDNDHFPERTIYLFASAMTLFCEMMIELYEVFEKHLNKPYDIINLINSKQIHLKKLKDRNNFYSKWLDYYHVFVLKYGNAKQKKENTDILKSHWNFSS